MTAELCDIFQIESKEQKKLRVKNVKKLNLKIFLSNLTIYLRM